MTAFIISPEHGGMLFAWFYFIAFIITFPILIAGGIQRKFPWVTWFYILIFGKLIFILGSKAGTLSGEDWLSLFKNLQLPAGTGKSAMGGFIAVLFLILLLRIIFKPRLSILDPFAITLPLALSIQRYGCLFAGCCYGTVTDLPWGVTYLPGSALFIEQLSDGQIQQAATHTIPVHPYPIYLIIGSLIILLFLLRIRHRIKRPGNLFFLSVALLLLLRFGLDFFRGTNIRGVDFLVLPGLSFVHILMFLISAILMVFIYYREKNRCPEQAGNSPPFRDHGRKSMLFLFLIIFLLWSLRTWLQPLEVLVLLVFLLPAGIGTALQVNQFISLPQIRWLSPALVCIGLLLMAQTTLKEVQPEREPYGTLSFGALFGGYEGGCNEYGPVERNYFTVGADYTRYFPLEKSKFRQGGYLGYQQEDPGYYQEITQWNEGDEEEESTGDKADDRNHRPDETGWFKFIG